MLLPFCVAIALLTVQAQLLGGSNSSALLTNSTATIRLNSPITGIGAGGAVPYHSLQGYANNSVSYLFGVSGSLTTQAQSSVEYPSSGWRADFRCTTPINIAATISNSSACSTYSTLRVSFSQSATNFSSTVSLLFHFVAKGKVFSATNLSQVQIGSLFFRCIAAGEYVLNSMSNTFSGSIDLDQLVVLALTTGIAISTDIVSQIAIVNTVDWGIGQVLMASTITATKTASFTSQTFSILSMTFAMEVLPNKNSTLATDYLNVTMSPVPASISDLAFDYLQYVPIYNGKMTIKVGYHNGTWVTPIGTYLLPLVPSSPAQLISNFGFTHNMYNASGQSEGCWYLSLRSDWDPVTQTFTTTRKYPNREIHLCPWTSLNSSNNGVLQGTVSYQGINYQQYRDVYYSPDGTEVWAANIYACPYRISSMNNIDLQSFCRYLLNYSLMNSSEVLVGIEAGFRIYSGWGSWKYVGLTYSTVPSGGTTLVVPLYTPSVPPPLPTPKATPNNSVTPPTPPQPTPYNNNSFPTSGAFQYSCSFLGSQNQNGTCLPNDSLLGVVRNILSTPNLAILGRMASFLRIVDDFSYYVYHHSAYDNQFLFVARMAWNLTNSKWMIPWLETAYDQLSTSYMNSMPPRNQDDTSPQTYLQLNQDGYFMKQTADYWLCTVPVTIVTFLILHYISLFLRKRQAGRYIARFRWVPFMMVSLVGENLQYLSFRCFSQLYILTPSSQRTFVQYCNLCWCYFILFAVVVYGCCCFIYMPIYLGKDRSQILEDMSYSSPVVAQLSIFLLSKILAGAIHSLLYDHQPVQISLLLAIQLGNFSLSVWNRSYYIKKTLFALNTLECLFRMVVHIALLCEVLVPNNEVLFALSFVTASLCQALLLLSIVNILVATSFLYQGLTGKHDPPNLPKTTLLPLVRSSISEQNILRFENRIEISEI